MPGSTSNLNKFKSKHSGDENERTAATRVLPTRSNSTYNWRGTHDENAVLKRSLDEQRLHVVKLKNELDLEKEKAKQVCRDQLSEVKRVRNECGLENSLNLEANSRKMKRAHELELKKLREMLAREKDVEIKQIIKFKDEEIRTMRKGLLDEHVKVLKNTEEQYKQKFLKGKSPCGSETERKLRQEIVDLKRSKEEMEFSYRAQVSITNEKKEQIVKIKTEFERETNKLRKENQKEHMKHLTEIKQLRKELQEQTSVAEKSNVYASRLIEEKQDLAKRLKQDRIQLQEKSFNSTDGKISGSHNQMEKDRGLQSKNVELRRQLDESNKKLKLLEKEKQDASVLHSTPIASTQNSSSLADKKSIKLLKRRNAELVAIAKKLEEKGLRTQKELDELKAVKLGNGEMLEGSENINSLRKSFAIKRAKDLAENARILLQKDKQIEELKHTKTSDSDLERRLFANQDDGSEYLHLQTELSNALEKNQNISVELDHLKDTHATCDEYIEELINKQNELKSLTHKLTEKDEECTALSTSILKKDQEMSFLQKEIKDKEFQCCRLIEETDAQKCNIRDLEENILKYKEQLVSLKKLKEERDQLNSLLLNANNYSNKLEEEIDELQNQIDDIKKTVLDQQDKIKLLTSENSQAKEKLLERERQLAELHKVQEESLIAYNTSVSTLKDDLKNIETKCSRLESHEKVLNKQLEQTGHGGKNGLVVPRRNIYTQTGFGNDVQDFCVQFPSENERLAGNNSQSYSRKRRTKSSRRRASSPTEINDEVSTENCSLSTNQQTRVKGLLSSDDELQLEDLDGGEENEDLESSSSPLYNVPVLFNRFRKAKSSENLFRLYVAKYTYDPSLYSPNEDHDLELPLEAGMQVYVYGEMDEDGFYLAESKNGQRGLVPSNLVELVGDGLSCTRFDSSAAEQMLNAYASDEEMTEVPPLDADAMRRLSEIPIPDEYLQQSPKVDTTTTSTPPAHTACTVTTPVKGSEEKLNCTQTYKPPKVPAPGSLRLERQLHNSTVMCWLTPQGIKQHKIKGYSIYVDGKRRQTILGSTRTKALVSDIDQKQAYRISVHTLTVNGDESRDELAVVTVGTGGNIHAPYDLKVSNVKSLSADLYWKPSNSCHYHSVYSRDKNITTLQPGVCTYSLNNLTPDTTYKIRVESRKYISKPSPPDWSASIELRTLSGVSPDAPLYVCSEVSRDHLSVSWLPVTINEECGSSNGSIVTGYNVYINSRQYAAVSSPTSDAVDIPLSKILERFSLAAEAKPLQVCVRTQSSAGESENSNISIVDMRSEDLAESGIASFMADLDEMKESVIDELSIEEVSLADSDPNYEESLKPSWCEIGVAFKDTDNIDSHFDSTSQNPSNIDNRFFSDCDNQPSESDGELSVIEEVSETETAPTSKLFESRSQSFLLNQTEPLKATSTYVKTTKPSKSEPISINRTGIENCYAETSPTTKDSLDSSHSSTRTYTLHNSKSELSVCSQNHESTFTLSGSDRQQSNSSCNDNDNTFTILPDADTKSISEEEKSPQSNADGNSSSKYNPLNSDSNSMMDDSLIESVQMSSMKLSGIIASHVSELSQKLTNIQTLDSDEESISSLPVDDMEVTTRSCEEEAKMLKSKLDSKTKTCEINTNDEVEPRREHSVSGSGGELDTGQADPADLVDDSSRIGGGEGYSGSDSDDGVRVVVEIPKKVSVAERITEFESQKDHLKLIKMKSAGDDNVDKELEDNTSLTNGCRYDSVFLDVTPSAATKHESSNLNVNANASCYNDAKETRTSPEKIGFIDAAKFAAKDNKLSVEKSWHSSNGHLTNGNSQSSSGEEEETGKKKWSSDEEVKLEIFNNSPHEETLVNGTDSNFVEMNNLINKSYLTRSSNTMSSGSVNNSRYHTNDNSNSSDEYSVNEKLSLERSVTSKQSTIMYTPQVNDDEQSEPNDNYLQFHTTTTTADHGDGRLVMNKPVLNMYSFGGDIDISSSEHEISESNNTKHINGHAHVGDDDDDDDGNDDFNVTEINETTCESTVSRISTIRSDSERLNNTVENADEPLRELNDVIEHSDDDDKKFECSSPLESRSGVDPNLLFECPLPEQYRKDYDGDDDDDQVIRQRDETKCRVFVANFSYDPLTMSPNVELVDDELAFCTGDLIKVYGEIGIDGFYFGELNGKRGYLPGNMVTEVERCDDEKKKLEPLMNGDSFFDISPSNRAEGALGLAIDEENVIESKNNPTNHIASSSGTNSATKMSRTGGKRGLNSKSSSTNNLSRDSAAYAAEDLYIESQGKSTSMPNVSSDYFDRFEYDLDDDMYDQPDPYLMKPLHMISLFPYDPSVSSPNVDAEVELTFNAGELIEVYGEMDEDGFYAGKLNNVKGLVPSNFVREATEKEVLKGFSATSTTLVAPPKKSKSSFIKKSKKIFSRLKGKQ